LVEPTRETLGSSPELQLTQLRSSPHQTPIVFRL